MKCVIAHEESRFLDYTGTRRAPLSVAPPQTRGIESGKKYSDRMDLSSIKYIGRKLVNNPPDSRTQRFVGKTGRNARRRGRIIGSSLKY